MRIYRFHGKKNVCGPQIKKLRMAKGMTQEDLAAQMQICGIIIERHCISRTEKGTRFIPDYELPVYAKIFQVPLEALFDTDDK